MPNKWRILQLGNVDWLLLLQRGKDATKHKNHKIVLYGPILCYI